jgi:hypothetical protein
MTTPVLSFVEYTLTALFVCAAGTAAIISQGLLDWAVFPRRRSRASDPVARTVAQALAGEPLTFAAHERHAVIAGLHQALEILEGDETGAAPLRRELLLQALAAARD